MVGTPSDETAGRGGERRGRGRLGWQGRHSGTAVSGHARVPPPHLRSSRTSSRRRRGLQGWGAARAAGGASAPGPRSRHGPTQVLIATLNLSLHAGKTCTAGGCAGCGGTTGRGSGGGSGAACVGRQARLLIVQIDAHMISPFEIQQAIWVIDPSTLWCDMVERAAGVLCSQSSHGSNARTQQEALSGLRGRPQEAPPRWR